MNSHSILFKMSTMSILSDYKIIRADDGFFNVLIDGRQTYRTDTITDAYYNMFLFQVAEKQHFG
jgi:hypothetical protein